jgi:hypothetical protein
VEECYRVVRHFSEKELDAEPFKRFVSPFSKKTSGEVIKAKELTEQQEQMKARKRKRMTMTARSKVEKSVVVPISSCAEDLSYEVVGFECEHYALFLQALQGDSAGE